MFIWSSEPFGGLGIVSVPFQPGYVMHNFCMFKAFGRESAIEWVSLIAVGVKNPPDKSFTVFSFPIYPNKAADRSPSSGKTSK